MNRRDLLKKSLCLAASTAGFGALSSRFSLAHAATMYSKSQRYLLGNDYRALVCVFLYGGNDSLNFIVPRDVPAHATYAATRGSIAVPRSELVSLTPTASGAAYGLHPGVVTGASNPPHASMTALATLFNQPGSPLAIVANTGPLLYPTTKTQYNNESVALPPQLFSHDDQSAWWQTPTANSFDRIGWGGILADRFGISNPNQNLAMTISTDGDNVYQTAADVVPYFVSAWGVNRIDNINPTWSEPTARRDALYQLLNGPLGNPLERTYATGFKRTVSNYEQVISALQPSETTFDTIFGADDAIDDDLTRQLKMVARLISARDTLQMTRQIFFVGLGGFDTHDSQASAHPGLLAAIANGLTKFYQATQQMGIANQVTSFTASEFGRTLTNNGDGTDHGWGGHHLVIGGAVNGGRFFGRFPSLATSTSNPDDAGWGQIIPTTSVDQYAWTLARWYGLPDDAGGRGLVFPNVTRFTDLSQNGTGSSHLGFLPAAI
ncbi:MAG TPA: DUF1501 domain-containing protein [Pseudomonadota bacterium]|nr:DUF1501 domain-containing protein [Xanthomonadales bacterium]HQW80408.1 DUF1501 domain-containing protein [Pseudomonadota bacterium]